MINPLDTFVEVISDGKAPKFNKITESIPTFSAFAKVVKKVNEIIDYLETLEKTSLDKDFIINQLKHSLALQFKVPAGHQNKTLSEMQEKQPERCAHEKVSPTPSPYQIAEQVWNEYKKEDSLDKDCGFRLWLKHKQEA